jgi:hypothetical protein
MARRSPVVKDEPAAATATATAIFKISKNEN